MGGLLTVGERKPFHIEVHVMLSAAHFGTGLDEGREEAEEEAFGRAIEGIGFFPSFAREEPKDSTIKIADEEHSRASVTQDVVADAVKTQAVFFAGIKPGPFTP